MLIVVSYKVASSPASSAGTAPKVISLGQAELSSSEPHAVVTAASAKKVSKIANDLLIKVVFLIVFNPPKETIRKTLLCEFTLLSN